MRTLAALGRVTIQPAPLLAVLDAPSDDPKGVIAAIESSPALSGRLLGVTNSAGMGVRRHIDSVRRAVIHLGASRARLIALAFGLRMLSEKAGLPPRTVQHLWVTSLRKAAAAKLAADLIDPRHTDQAYTAALLQDIGLPMLMAVDPAFYHHEMHADGGSWCEQETLRFGLDHAAVGARLLEQWHLYPKFSDTVLDHHRPPLDESGKEAIYKLSSYIASLIPHLNEVPTPYEREWMIALHAQFLSEHYASPQAFWQAAAKAAAPLHGGERGSVVKIDAAQARQIIEAVTCDSESLVTQLCQLEESMGRQREHLSHLRFQAFTDPLTKVLNRRGFVRLAQRRLEAAVNRELGACALLIDLDDFKPVNDRFGHEAGDLVLRGLSKLLRRHLDRSDLICRLGGDEFAVLMIAVDESKARQIAQRLIDACMGTRIRIGSTPAHVAELKLSMGAAYYSVLDSSIDVEDMLAAADKAMYERKRSGKHGLTFACTDD